MSPRGMANIRIVFFVSNGLLLGANTTIGWMFFNQSAAVLGNAIGGAPFFGRPEPLQEHPRDRLTSGMGAAPWDLGSAEAQSKPQEKGEHRTGEKRHKKR